MVRLRPEQKATRAASSCFFCQGISQPFEERYLCWIDFRYSQVPRKKFRAVDFGKLLGPSRARRPFQFKGVGNRRKVDRQVRLCRPAVHCFAAFLFYAAEINPRVSRRCRDAEFFLELDRRARRQIFVVAGFPLWNCPRPQVLVSKKRAARMDKENLDRIVSFSKDQQAGACRGSFQWR